MGMDGSYGIKGGDNKLQKTNLPWKSILKAIKIRRFFTKSTISIKVWEFESFKIGDYYFITL